MRWPISARADRPAARPTRRRGLTVLAVLALLAGTMGGFAPASAAPGTLGLTMAPVDAANGNAPVTDAQTGNGPAGYASDQKITYLFQYSCGGAPCQGTQVQVTPPQSDPAGVLPPGRAFLAYDSFSPGASGATISGDDVAGMVVDLGDLAAGTSGSFAVTYSYEADRASEVPNSAFYPDGTVIEMGAEITSDSAPAVSRDAAGVRWHLDEATEPKVAMNTGTYDPDVPVQLMVEVGGGNMATHGSLIYGHASQPAVGSYTITYQVPPQATINGVYINGTHMPDELAVVDPVANTVTWSLGSPTEPAYGARGVQGVGAVGNYNGRGTAANNVPGEPLTHAFWGRRIVDVTFDGEQFDPSGCGFTETLQTRVDASLTYLDAADPAERTTKTVENATRDLTVACQPAFGGLLVDKRISGGQYDTGDGIVSGSGRSAVFAQNVPGPGQAEVRDSWRVYASNLGNQPGVAVIEESDLVHDHLKVDTIRPVGGVGATVEWTADDGSGTITSGTSSLPNNGTVTAPSGGWFTAATVTTDQIAPGRTLPDDTTETKVGVHFEYRVDADALDHLGERRTNTAEVTMLYPGFGGANEPPITDLDGDPMGGSLSESASRSLEFTQPSPRLRAQFATAPTVETGDLAAVTPGTPVTWSVRAMTENVWPGTRITPQLVFVAPLGWDIDPSSATMADGAPAGVTYQHSRSVVDGQERDVLVATWPEAIEPSDAGQEYLPALSVVATPSGAAPAGIRSVAQAWAGDDGTAWKDVTGDLYLTGPAQFRALDAGVTDSGDVDGDGDQAEAFARTPSTFDVRVTALPAFTAIKEICEPTPSASDGCTWSDASQAAPVQVPDDAPVAYRVTLVNSGNVDLTGAVATDILPHEGDVRGSDVDQALTGPVDADTGLTVEYSTSPDPGAGDWAGGAEGARAVRLTAGDLPIGASRSAVLTADAQDAAPGDGVCNALSVVSDQTLVTSTTPVCAQYFTPTAGLSLTKTAELDDANDNGSADPGETVVYVFEVENSGNIAVDDVTIDDPMLSDASVEVTPAATDLAVGATATFTSQAYEVTQADVDAGSITNTAVATGSAASGPVSSEESSAVVPTPDRDPALSIDKTSRFVDDGGTEGVADLGDVLEYEFTVVNEGNVTVAEVSVDDPRVETITPGPVTLAPGQEQVFTSSYTVTQDDVNRGQVYNVATATGTSPLGPLVSAPDENRVAGPDPAPRVTIEKSAELTTDEGQPAHADRDDVITYTFTVRNDGPGTAYDVAVLDELEGLSALVPASVAVLEPGEEQVFTATYVVTQSDVDRGEIFNQATGRYTPPDTDPDDGLDPEPLQTPPSELVRVPAAEAEPALEVIKDATLDDANGNEAADVGETIAYTFEVENTGNRTLEKVAVQDARVEGITPQSVVLAPGDSQTFTAEPYTVTQADVDAGGVRNVATATGSVPNGPEVTSPPARHEATVVAAAPALVLEKLADLEDGNGNGTADEGESIVYSFDLTNSGNVTLHDVTVQDERIADLLPDAVGQLAPGVTVRVTAEPYEVTESDVASGEIVNVASATAVAPDERSVSSPEDEVVVEVTEADPEAENPGSDTGGSPLPDTGGVPLDVLAAALGLLSLGVLLVLGRSTRRRTRT